MRIELMAFVTGAALACVIAPSVAQNTVVPVTIDNFVFEPARVLLWTKDKLDAFLSDTEAMYPGGWMGSPPIRDAKQRADLLCVLGTP